MDSIQWWGHGFGFMWVIPLFFFVVFIIIMRGMFGRASHGCDSYDNRTTHHETARDILDKRFAKGEITRQEYEDMKVALEDDSP